MELVVQAEERGLGCPTETTRQRRLLRAPAVRGMARWLR